MRIYKASAFVAIGCCVLVVGLFLEGTLEAAEEKAPVEGTFLGNGKEAALHHVLIQKREPWQEETAYMVILSEKDPATVEKPDFAAMFGELGHALVFSITVGGELFGVQICHQGLERTNISPIGTTEVRDFQLVDGRLSARFLTTEEQEFFGDRWQFDVRVSAPLPQ